MKVKELKALLNHYDDEDDIVITFKDNPNEIGEILGIVENEKPTRYATN